LLFEYHTVSTPRIVGIWGGRRPGRGRREICSETDSAIEIQLLLGLKREKKRVGVPICFGRAVVVTVEMRD